MRAHRRNSAPAVATAAVILSTAVGLGVGTAAAAIPVQYQSNTSAYNSISPKMVAAECPAGSRVLGGAALIDGGPGQVAIQAAFPTYDLGLNKDVFVVKAAENMAGTLENWSVTANAYCTPTIAPMLLEEPSLFDSDAIKSATVTCPEGFKVVGMGGEVSNTHDSHPAPLVTNIPAAVVAFQGVEADADLTSVTARATERSGALGGSTNTPWKVTAVAACAQPLYFDGLELRQNTERGGGLTELEEEVQLEINCSSKSQRIISAASTVDDDSMGRWFLHRFSRYNAFQPNRLSADSYRNSGVGIVHQAAYIICGN